MSALVPSPMRFPGRFLVRLLATIWMAYAGAPIAAPLLFAEATVDNPAPWVQSQAILTLRFWQGSDVRQVEFHPPQSRLADVWPLGPPRVLDAMKDGVRYRRHEQRYAVVPFSSGPVELHMGGASGRPFGSPGAARWDAPALQLAVRPPPAGGSTGPWLPATALTLTEQWENSDTMLRPGDLIRRRITISARGVSATQLPPTDFAITGATVLAGTPQLTTITDAGGVIARREQVFDIVPTRSGEFLVPEIRISAWHPDDKQAISVSAPTRRLAVGGSDGIRANSTAPTKTPAPSFAAGYHALLLAIIAITVLLATWFPLRPIWSLLRAGRCGNLHGVRDFLFGWCQRRGANPRPQSLLPMIASTRDFPTQQLLLALDAALYSANQTRPAFPARSLIRALWFISPANRRQLWPIDSMNRDTT
jgi:hypothetical protein